MKEMFLKSFGMITGLYAGLVVIEVISNAINPKNEKPSEEDFVNEEEA